MTQEDKELLLKDLCARLSYGTNIYYKTSGWEDKNCTLTPHVINNFLIRRDVIIKPYLRPLSSMTEEERKEIGILIKEKRPNPYGIIKNEGVDNLFFSVSVASTVLIDWLNKNHFDYRGLIEKGLAIAVANENNPYEK